MRLKIWALVFVCVCVSLRAIGVEAAEPTYDVAIYSATASGVSAGVAAARNGAKVIILEPGNHVGGMVSGGLGHTDMHGQGHLIGGFAREFFERVGQQYGKGVWNFEPHFAEQVFRELLNETGVEIVFSQSVKSVDKEGSRIASLQTADGKTYRAKVWIDCSYEGDVMAAAGVSYVVGREGREKYGESLAGRQDFLPGQHQFRFGVSPYDEKGKFILPYIIPQEKAGQLGEGDGKFQAYCFRLCLSNREDNRLPIEKPAGYDPARYELQRRYIKAGGDRINLGDFVGIAPVPNGKCDVNSNGPLSTDLLGASWEYPDATPARRKEIWDEHLRWAQGLIYFLQNDEAVPRRIRDEMGKWGLPKDEFTDTGGWPHQLYVREGRRMIGEYVLTEHDLTKNRQKDDSIGMGGYNIDIREVQWVSRRVYHFPKAADELLMEGYVSQPVEPYQIPYRSMLPKSAQCENLLVPVCLSASTVAYASYRMEPNYMIAGESAGTAAAMAAKANVSVQKLDVAALQQQLEKQRQILSLKNVVMPETK